MPSKPTRDGAFCYFKKAKIILGERATNGAFEIINVSSLSAEKVAPL